MLHFSNKEEAELFVFLRSNFRSLLCKAGLGVIRDWRLTHNSPGPGPSRVGCFSPHSHSNLDLVLGKNMCPYKLVFDQQQFTNQTTENRTCAIG